MPSQHLHDLLTKFQNLGRVALVGPGPSMSSLDDKADYDLTIFIGDSFLRKKWNFGKQIFVRANTEFPSLENPRHVEALKRFNGDIAIASSVMESRISLQKLVQVHLPEKNVYLFDQRHFSNLNCTPKNFCCQHKQEPTIQEEVSRRFGLRHHYSEGSTVFLHALSIAIMMESKSIDIFGVDLPLKVKKYEYAPAAKLPSRGQSQKLGRLGNISPKPAFLIKSLARRLFFILMPNHAPSVFAEDYLHLFQDLQILSDVASFAGVKLSASGNRSLLLKFPGICEIGTYQG